MASNQYLQWLQSPTTASLASDASLHYITTTTTITEPAAILKHLAAQAKQVEQKEQKILHVIDGDNAACIETSTTLQFRVGGGAYLPSIDSNLLDERTVLFPLTHIVSFNAENKIQQIRLYWDQATLLKQVEAIGKSGRNWPIRDGKAQTDMVASSAKIGGSQSAASNGKEQSSKTREPAEMAIRGGHSKRDSVSVTRDPHASLALFSERDPNEDVGSQYAGPKHATRMSAKPPPREYSELFASGENAPPLGSQVRATSPHKTDGTILKAGAGKNFSENRLFKEDGPADEPRSPERKRTYSQKYEHFAFGNGEDAPETMEGAASRSKSRGGATFSFEDFSTPPKVKEKARPDYERHWGAGVDEQDPPESPPKRPVVHAPRPDAEPHFELLDKTPQPSRADKEKSSQRERGAGTSNDSVLGDERMPKSRQTTTNVDNSRRGKDFGSQYEIKDASPGNAAKTTASRSNARSDLDSHWSFGTPEPVKKIYKTAGDGMGSRAGARSWGIGDDSDPEVEADLRKSARSRRKAEADELNF